MNQKIKNGKSLRSKTYLYLISFAVLLLILVLFFEILLFDKFYELGKTNEMESTAFRIKESYLKNDYKTIENEAFKMDSCIEITNSDGLVYTSSFMPNGCNIEADGNYKRLFSESSDAVKTYKIVNKRFNNNTLVYAMKLDDGNNLFVSTSIVPLKSTTNILYRQFFHVSFIVLFVSGIVAYYFASMITGPIKKISNAANKLSDVDEEIDFSVETDINELNELSDILDNAHKELSQTENIRREMLANVSHDLKTPLTMIQAYAEMARDLNSKNKEKREENLNVIIDESKRLNLLVNDIVDFSRIQSNGLNLNISEFNLNELIRTIIKRYGYLEDNGFVFEFNATSDFIVSADIKRIEQVIYNLINNAVNYVGNDKKVIINLSKKGNRVLVEVIDHGPGISKENINHIWEKYYKVDKKYSRDKVGTGIGLSIVKAVLVKHNVEYGVKSKVGKGSNFYFLLKLK